MSHDSAAAELKLIAEETRQHLLYLQELGIDSFEPSGAPQPPATKRLDKQSSAHLQQAEARIAKPVMKAASTASRMAPANAPATAASHNLFGEIFQSAKDQLPASTETFEQIWKDVGDCRRCSLCSGRTNVVHTEGNRRARLMFVGEAPGADEDEQARPFVGRAGQLLTKIIEAIGLKREDVLIGNINRCRPPANRPPTPDEVMMCKPFLLREIATARPEVIVVLGNTAMKNLLEIKDGITRVRGIFQTYKGVKVMPTYHPAYLLRDPSKKRETWEDLKKVRDYLDSRSENG